MQTHSAGPQWRKRDLQLRTPASFDWSGTHFAEMGVAATHESVGKIVSTINALDCAACSFMDYWTFDGYFKVRKVAQETGLEIQKTLFPGMEIRIDTPASLNIHVLFDEDTSDQTLREFKSRLRLLGQQERALSDSGLREYGRELFCRTAHLHGFAGSYQGDEARLYELGAKTAKVTRESFHAAVKSVGNQRFTWFRAESNFKAPTSTGEDKICVSRS